MKIRTENELRDVLDEEFSWRRRELITLHLLLAGGRGHQAEALRRAAITLLYRATGRGLLKKLELAMSNSSPEEV